MTKYNSGRVKRYNQLGITSDRYQFLGLEQAEPDLGDPIVGVSSVGVNPYPLGDQYVLAAVDGHIGNRYWIKTNQLNGVGAQGTSGVQGPLSNFQGTQGTQSTQGAVGNQGNQGTQGNQGLQGPLSNFQGTQGTQGQQGTQGNQGTQGTQGQQGTQGNQGTQGRQGTQGNQGVQGPLSNFQGTQGTQGNQGTQGLQGNQGTQGLQGNQGTQGQQGTQGLQGNQGTQGTQGLQGNQGAQGTQGAQGLQGNQGFQGTQGLQGNQGTQGAQGTQGQQGTQGNQGTQGVQGLQGLQGSQGIISNFQGTQGNQGTQGRQGTQGLFVQGSQGSQGFSGALGSQGNQGTQGTQGPQAPQGGQGTQGKQGGQGVQGLSGANGTGGSQGNQGVQGLQGPQGTQGRQGTQGLGGATGNSGASGTTSFAAMDTSLPDSLVLGNGAVVSTVYSYNGQSADQSTTQVPPSTSIIVFDSNNNGTSAIRTVTNLKKIYLATVDSLYVYVNKGMGQSSVPYATDGTQDLTLQWSYDGVSWNNLYTITPTNILTDNKWTLVSIPTSVAPQVKYYNGVYLRFTNPSTFNNEYVWGATSTLLQPGSINGSSGGGGGSNSFAAIDVESSSTVSLPVTKPGVVLSTVANYNGGSADQSTTDVPPSTPIAVFDSNGYGTDGNRIINLPNRIFLAQVSSLSYYVNKGMGQSSVPYATDGTQNLRLEWSYDGVSWNPTPLDTVSPADILTTNKWTLRTISSLSSAVKHYNGVYLRFTNPSTFNNEYVWGITSVLPSFSSSTGSSGGGGSTTFSVLDLSSPNNVVFPYPQSGAALYTVASYNGGSSNTNLPSDVPSSTPIVVFDSNGYGVVDIRYVTTTNQVFLTKVNTLYFYVNKGMGQSSVPYATDGTQDLTLQWSYDGVSWNNLYTITPSSISNTNRWTLISASIPGGAKTYDSVYLRFKNPPTYNNSYVWGATSIVTELGSSAAPTIKIIDDTSTNASLFVGLVSSTSVSSGITTVISTSSPKLTFNPSSGTLSATVFTSLSDKTRKTNIQSIQSPVKIIQQLNGVTFNWADNNHPSIGLIAQDLEKVLPELVETDLDGLKSVNYGSISAILIEAVKEQQIKIEALEKKLNG